MYRKKMEKDKWKYYTLLRAGMKFRNKKKFRYDIPAYTGPFRALHVVDKIVLNFLEGKAVPQHTYEGVGGERIDYMAPSHS
jgi:hypothetical protein